MYACLVGERRDAVIWLCLRWQRALYASTFVGATSMSSQKAKEAILRQPSLPSSHLSTPHQEHDDREQSRCPAVVGEGVQATSFKVLHQELGTQEGCDT